MGTIKTGARKTVGIVLYLLWLTLQVVYLLALVFIAMPIAIAYDLAVLAIRLFFGPKTFNGDQETADHFAIAWLDPETDQQGYFFEDREGYFFMFTADNLADFIAAIRRNRPGLTLHVVPASDAHVQEAIAMHQQTGESEE